MSSSRNVSNNTYVVVYSCSRTTSNTWDCHDGWQITKLDAKITTQTTTPASSCNDGKCDIGETCSSCPADCGTCQSYTRTFYVSSSSTSSIEDGSINNPWKTLDKVNSQTFKPGDAILFKRGDTWYGTLPVKSSGSSTAPITYGAYGSGDKPIITGFTTISGWTNEGGGIYSKVVSTQSAPNMVTVDGVNTWMGRYPDTGWLTTTTVGTGYITDNSLPASPNWAGAEIVMRTDMYLINRGKITSQSTHQINYDRTGFAGTGNGYVGWGYFIQNDIRTLTTLGEWYYDDNTNKFYMYFGSVDPATKVVKVASLDTGVSSSQSYVTIDNINFQGFNGVGLNLDNSNHITVTNCEVGFTGSDGAVMGVNNLYDNFYLHDTNAIAISGSQNGFTLTNSRVENAGMIYGTGYGYDGQGKVMDYWGDNALVQYNVFRNIGADCVMVTGNNIAISNNLFDNCCAITADQGAIYVTGTGKSNCVISNNIIINTIGSVKGTIQSDDGTTSWNKGSNYFSTAEGIYLDEPTSGVIVTGNTVAGNLNGAGIKLHRAWDITVTNNTFFNNLEGNQFEVWNNETTNYLHNIVYTGNKIIPLESYQIAWAWATDNNLANNDPVNLAFTTLANNYYARPFNNAGGQENIVYDQIHPRGAWTMAQWVTYTGKESGSTFSSGTASSSNDILFEYNAAKTDKVITLNGNYRDVKGTAYSGSVTLAPYTSIVLIKN